LDVNNNKVEKFITLLKTRYDFQIEELRPKLNEFFKDSSDVLDKVIQIVDNDDVKKSLRSIGVIGPIIRLGFSIYDLISQNDKLYDLYYINKKSLGTYQRVVKEFNLDLDNHQISKKDEKKLIENLFEKSNDNQIHTTDIFSHPLIEDLKRNTLEIFKDKHLESLWLNFVIAFDIYLYDAIKNDPAYEKIKDEWKRKELYILRLKYFERFLKESEVPNKMDSKILSRYYVDGRLIELETGYNQQKDKNNELLSDLGCEEIYDNEQNRFEIIDFLNSS